MVTVEASSLPEIDHKTLKERINLTKNVANITTAPLLSSYYYKKKPVLVRNLGVTVENA
jgi:hypothetical protein